MKRERKNSLAINPIKVFPEIKMRTFDFVLVLMLLAPRIANLGTKSTKQAKP